VKVRLADLREMVGRIVEVDGVTASALCGQDGLVIEGSGPPAVLEQLAAYTPQIVRAAARMREELPDSTPSTVTIEWQGTAAVVHCLQDVMLVTVLDQPANSAYLRYLIDEMPGTSA